MASINVFGSPIPASSTHGLNTTPEERKALAEQAMGTRFCDDKYENAKAAVNKLKEKYCNGKCTVGLIYNATGSPITYLRQYNWEGQLSAESEYPTQLGNGQWGVFLHVQPSASSNLGSVGAVVYRGKDKTGTDYDRMLAWFNNPSKQPNAVYTEIREPGHYENNFWSYILGELKDSFRINWETGNGCRTYVKIGHGVEAPYFEGILTLDRVI